MNSILTCVYCGHQYPEGTPPHGDKLLTDHIKICKKHPLRKAEAKILELEIILDKMFCIHKLYEDRATMPDDTLDNYNEIMYRTKKELNWK